jgi:hypothetical protein
MWLLVFLIDRFWTVFRIGFRYDWPGRGDNVFFLHLVSILVYRYCQPENPPYYFFVVLTLLTVKLIFSYLSLTVYRGGYNVFYFATSFRSLYLFKATFHKIELFFNNLN